MSPKIRNLAVFAALLAGGASAAALAETPNVVVGIKPVHGLVAAVMEGVGEPRLLVDGAASPHDYALRPSEARAIADADLLIWVGPTVEPFLAKSAAALGDDRVVELTEAPGIELLPAREGGIWEAHDHGHDEGHAHEDAHDHETEHAHGAEHAHDDERGHEAEHAHNGDYDGHIWLDPDNAKAIVDAAATALAERDPANAARYQANADRTKSRIDALDAELAATLAPAKDAPFIVFHDAYQYLDAHYGLAAVGAISVNPEIPPSAQRIAEIRDLVAERGAVCIFAEPQFAPKVAQTIAEGAPARVGELDPISVGGEPGPDAWFRLMRDLGDSLAGCLKG